MEPLMLVLLGLKTLLTRMRKCNSFLAAIAFANRYN